MPDEGYGEQSRATRAYPGVAQLVERLLWEQDAAGSNPVTRTILAQSQEQTTGTERE